MKKSNIWWLVVVITLVVILGEFLFLNAKLGDALKGMETGDSSPLSGRENIVIFMLLAVLSFVPCMLMGYGEFNAFLGMIPPFFSTGFFWWFLHIKLKEIDPNIIGGFWSLAGFMVLSSSVFGIGVAYISYMIRQKLPPPGEEDPGEKKTPTPSQDQAGIPSQ